MIEIFDTQTPGNDTSVKLATIPNRKKHKKGQKGIISCIDFNKDRSGMYAAGSYSQSIGIYDERYNELCLKLIGMQGNGVTQVSFSLDGNYLFSTSRQSNVIECWDIRQSGNTLYELNRPGKTNQRVAFDLDPTGNVLVSGDQYGNVLAYDLTTIENQDMETKPRMLYSWRAHQDIVTSATINPIYPFLLATCSGQRKFRVGLESDDSEEEEEKEDDCNNSNNNNNIGFKKEDSIDNTLSIWHMKGNYEWYSIDNASSTDQSFNLANTIS
ncbi:WD40-repeat-containing domain protein [Cunninghamella echinulata]|nr:WD40-repeat-containing domain protein [Cunninghamella echinulata]